MTNLFSRMLKVFYNNGWFVGEIEYFNNTANKYRVFTKMILMTTYELKKLTGLK